MWLDDVEDVRSVINFERYGQPRVLNGHECFDQVSYVIDEFIEENMKWLEKRFNTGRHAPTDKLQQISLANHLEVPSHRNGKRQDKDLLLYAH